MSDQEVIREGLRDRIGNKADKWTGRGYYDPVYGAFVKGYWENGKIQPYQETLGHEIQYHLNKLDSEIRNPDD